MPPQAASLSPALIAAVERSGVGSSLVLGVNRGGQALQLTVVPAEWTVR